MEFGLPWLVVGEAPLFRGAGGSGFGISGAALPRAGRAIVFMQGPYDSCGKKVIETNMYDVFSSNNQ